MPLSFQAALRVSCPARTCSMLAALRGSVERLGVEQLEVYLVHNPTTSLRSLKVGKYAGRHSGRQPRRSTGYIACCAAKHPAPPP